jgi:nucleoid-associated protein YgaU
MKRISILLAALALCAAPALRAQDAATEERLNKLSGQIEDLKAGQDSLRKQVESLVKELDNLREQAGKPGGNYAAQEDLKRVAEAVKEVDQKRMDDAEKIRIELLNLRKGLLSQPTPQKKPAQPGPSETSASDKPEKGFEYTIQQGDTLSTIVKAYRDKNIKVNTDQILKANPDLKPEKMRVGQKIFIPAPKT